MRCHGCGSISRPVNERLLCKYCDELWLAVARRRRKLLETLVNRFCWRRR